MAEQKNLSAQYTLILVGSIFGLLSFIATVIISILPFEALIEAYKFMGEDPEAIMLFSFFMGLIGILVCITQLHLALRIKKEGSLMDFLYSLIIAGILIGLDAAIPAMLIFIGAIYGAYTVGNKKELPAKIVFFAALSGLIISLLGIFRYLIQKGFYAKLYAQLSWLFSEQFFSFFDIFFYTSTIISIVSCVIFFAYSFRLKEKQTKRDFICLIVISIISILNFASVIVLVAAIKGLRDLKRK